MERINLFITKEQKQTLNILKKTHQISYSTIVDLIAFHYYVNPYTRNLITIDSNIRQPKQEYKKTSIKVKNEYQLNAKTINNALQVYMLKMDKDPNNKDFYSQIRNKINHAFQDTYDEWYNYNSFCHMKERYQKENTKNE